MFKILIMSLYLSASTSLIGASADSGCGDNLFDLLTQERRNLNDISTYVVRCGAAVFIVWLSGT